jgi:hypothetical protein
MNDQLDGVSILTSPETVGTAEELVDELQTREDTIPGASTTTTPRPGQTEMEATTAPSEDIGEDTGLSCPLMVVGAFIAGGLGGGVTAALICASRKGADGAAGEQL